MALLRGECGMTAKRYRLDLGSIIDNETGCILSEVQVRNRLNQYDEELKRLKKESEKRRYVMK